MNACFTWLLIFGGGVFAMLSLIRWFEQVNEAVAHRWWGRIGMLVFCPFSTWFFPSPVAVGRPSPVARHEPVRGFGSLPKEKAPPVASRADEAPPGTPAEFLVKPQVPAKPLKTKAAIDPEKIAKLKQKMREQGMMGDE